MSIATSVFSIPLCFFSKTVKSKNNYRSELFKKWLIWSTHTCFVPILFPHWVNPGFVLIMYCLPDLGLDYYRTRLQFRYEKFLTRKVNFAFWGSSLCIISQCNRHTMKPKVATHLEQQQQLKQPRDNYFTRSCDPLALRCLPLGDLKGALG